MSRKLVVIKKVTDISPIPDADLIVLATVDEGWKCVVKKDEFQVGDLAVYFEIDSFLPVVPEFEFLRKSCAKKMMGKEGFRLKSMTLKKVLSQGLLLPIDSIKNLIADKQVSLEKGFDLTEALGVEKYEGEIPACISGEVVGEYPTHLFPKTDEERIQNLYATYSKDFSDNNEEIIIELSKQGDKYLDRIEELKTNRKINLIKDAEFEATIKLDGTSMTTFIIDTKQYSTKHTEKSVITDDFYFGVCGRNYELREKKGNTYWDVANRDIKENLINFFKRTGRSIAIQGELMGEGIQKNREKIKGHKFFSYKIYDIDKKVYLTRKERMEILDELGITTVPFLENIKVFKELKTLEEILKYAEGKSINNDVREGVVFKTNELIDGVYISFKAISNLFLLKGGE